MRITFISPAPNLSGGQRVIAIHADKLLERGHEVTVVTRGHTTPSLKNKVNLAVRGKRPPTPPRETHFGRMKARLVILPHSGPVRAEDVPDADIVIATWWETAFEIVHFPPSKGRKFYFVQGHEIFAHLPTHISGASYFLPLKKITISSWLVATMRDLYKDGDVALVPNSVDHSLFHSVERIRQPVPTVGLMYASVYMKGVDIVFRAIDVARRTHPNLRVVAFGAKRPTSQLPLPRGAEFHLDPPQTYLRQIYESCDVFVAASRSGGVGLPILEAMACRTPVVATLNEFAKDAIQDGHNGFAVAVEDAETLGARLTDTLSMSDAGWKAMSEAAFRKATEYTWDDASELFEDALLRH